MNGIIYKATNKINGNVYIGKTTKDFIKRLNEHKNLGKSGAKKYYFYNAIRKHGFENFEWEIIYDNEGRNINLNILNTIEKFFIYQYKVSGIKLYNTTIGGDGIVGLKFTDEHRKKISEANKGRIHSDETKKLWSSQRKGKKPSEESKLKISESQKGKKLSQETKDKISKLHKGRVLTEEHKLKLSLAKKGKPSPHRGRIVSDETRKKQSLAQKNRFKSQEQRDHISKKITEFYENKIEKVTD